MGLLGLSKGPQCSKIRVYLFCLHHPVLCTSNFLIVAKMYTVHLIFPTRCTTSSSCSAPLPPPLSQPPLNLRLPPPLPQPPYRPAPIGHRSLRLLLPRRNLDLGGASAGSWLPLPESAWGLGYPRRNLRGILASLVGRPIFLVHHHVGRLILASLVGRPIGSGPFGSRCLDLDGF
jgi:hypothetical protein